jgi:hypothetical protein
MTVSSTSSRVVYNGDGSTTTFPFGFKVQQAADLVVVYTDATGTDFTLSGSQYGATRFGVDAGGTVSYPLSGGAIAPGTTLTIYRQVAVTQPTSISNQGAMWPQVIEAALDRLTCIAQGVSDSISRALVISPTDGGSLAPLPNRTQRANAVLGFDGTGQPAAVTLESAGLIAWATWLAQNFAVQATSAANACAAIGAASLTATSQAFTGAVNFATQAANDSSTLAATTAYADRASATRAVFAAGINFNSANSDNAIAIPLPAGFTRYRIERVTISGASHSLTTATCGLFTAINAGGVAAVAGASAISVGATADATANNMQSLTLASGTTSFAAATLYFRVQTAEGAAATGDVAILYQPLK